MVPGEGSIAAHLNWSQQRIFFSADSKFKLRTQHSDHVLLITLGNEKVELALTVPIFFRDLHIWRK